MYGRIGVVFVDFGQQLRETKRVLLSIYASESDSQHTHLSLSDRLGKLYVRRFYADFGRGLDLLPDVHVGIVAAAYLDDDQPRLKPVEPFGQRGGPLFQSIFRLSKIYVQNKRT